jgi:transcriptional regulator with XRE-family HTH domain
MLAAHGPPLAIVDFDMAYMVPNSATRQVFYVEGAMNDKIEPSEIFKKRLKTARETLRKWSQSQLGEKAKLPPSSIAHFETGTRKPSFDTLRRLANALEVSTDYLLGRVDDPGLAEAGDPLYRDVGKLTGRDREIAKDFLKMLADKDQAKRKE